MKFPSIAQSEKDKSKKEYYEEWVKAIVCNTFNNSWSTNYQKTKLLYEFFRVGTGSNMTGYLQTAPDGSPMPGIWTSVSNVQTRLNALVGELEDRSYSIRVRPLNPEAVDRKREEKERLRVRRRLQELHQFVEETAGVQLEPEEYIPQSESELNEYMELSWKDKHAVIIEAALKWIAHRTDWDETRKRLFLDVLIANIMIVCNEIVDGVPQSRHVDPMKFIYDPNASNDTLSDATYFGEVEYLPLASAAERYGLTLKELEECYDSYKTYLGLGMDARSTSPNHNDFGYMPNQTMKWFDDSSGIPRTLVVKGVWRDYKQLAHKSEENEKGVFFQDVSDSHISKKDKDKIVYNKIECWRQGTLVGGKFLREHGECPNQARDIESLEKSESPYKVWIPSFFLGQSISLVERQVGLSLIKDICMFKIQTEIAKSVGKVVVLDEAMFPEGMTRESVISYIKADGIAFVNSKEYQLGTGNMNLIKDLDLSMSQTVGQQIQLIQYLDQQIDQISGVNAERQGQVAGASTAVGVQQQALNQSNLITMPYFKGFERFTSRCLNHQAKLVKLAWGNKEVFAPIIGDVGVNFLADNTDISLDSFDVVAESLPPQTMNKQKIEGLLQLAVQNGEISVVDAIDIIMEPDVTNATLRLRRKLLNHKLLALEQEEMMNQREMQMQQAQMQQQGAIQQGNWQTQLELQNMKNKSAMQKTLATGRVKLQDSKLKLLSK